MPKVRFEGQEYLRRDDESVLDALTRGGATITHSCRRGTCHACLMRVIEGDVSELSKEGLSDELIESGHFLPCQERNTAPLSVAEPDFSFSYVEARLIHREALGGGFWRLRFRPKVPARWTPGQYLHLRREDGETRSYCIVNQGKRTNFVEFILEEVKGGVFTQWLCHDLPLRATVELQGPHGNCHLRDDDPVKPLVFLGGGAAVASLRAIAQDILVRGWNAPLRFIYLSDRPAPQNELDTLAALTEEHPHLHIEAHASTPLEAILPEDSLEGAIIFIAGDPDFVTNARAEAILAGAERRDVRSNAFEPAQDYWPSDTNPFDLFQPDPELWKALDEGKLLRTILEDFYTEIYADELLSPFFENVTKERAVAKQWSFLADAFSGSRDYFGLKPFNAHHWMIISDELFDYREDMFERYLDKYNVARPHRRMWLAYQERFRRELVKHKARGLIIDGVEKTIEGFSTEQLTVGSVCDGCVSEMPPGTWGRLHLRTGRLYCEECRAVAVTQS